MIAQNPGKGTRRSYLKSEAVKRVAQGPPVYYSSEEETEVKNEPGTSSTVKQEAPTAQPNEQKKHLQFKEKKGDAIGRRTRATTPLSPTTPTGRPNTTTEKAVDVAGILQHLGRLLGITTPILGAGTTAGSR